MNKKSCKAIVALFYLLLVSLVLVSCNRSNEQQQEQNATAQQPVTYPKDTFKAGEVIPRVALRLDSNQTYALYLPTGYSDSIKYPVIIFFDPHGEGALPLNLYHQLADKYHFVLMGSNNSKNLQSIDLSVVFANNIISEAPARFSIDPSRIALMGFSGGAKVAQTAGANNTRVGAIIYAGAETDDAYPNHSIITLGFAGTKDMNYTDLVQYDRDLSKTTIPHYLVEWKGKHEFPTADVFEDAFIFLTTGKIDNYEKKQATISPEKVEEELAIKKKYVNAFRNKESLDWWKKEIARLNVEAKTDPMYARMLGFISLACYSFSNQDLVQDKIDEMGRIIEIYKIADPGNKDCDTLYATYLRKKAGQ